jgi:hypothetical protein
VVNVPACCKVYVPGSNQSPGGTQLSYSYEDNGHVRGTVMHFQWEVTPMNKEAHKKKISA